MKKTYKSTEKKRKRQDISTVVQIATPDGDDDDPMFRSSGISVVKG